MTSTKEPTKPVDKKPEPPPAPPKKKYYQRDQLERVVVKK